MSLRANSKNGAGLKKPPLIARRPVMTPAAPAPRATPVAAPKRPPARFLRLPEVIKRVGLSRSTIYRMMEREPPGFPKPFKPSEVASRWLESDIDDFMAAVIEGRRWSPSGSVARN